MDKPDDESPGATCGEGESGDTTSVHITGTPDSTTDILAMLHGFMLNPQQLQQAMQQQQQMQQMHQQISQLLEEVQKGKTKQQCVVTPLPAANPDTLTRPAPQSPGPAEEVLAEHLDKKEEAEMKSEEVKQPLSKANDESKPETDGSSGGNRETTKVLPPPGDVHFLSLTSDSVSLSWGSPEGLAGPQKFRVTWGCDGEEKSLRVEDGCNVEIDGLQPGEKYQFNVATEGEDGSHSRWVSASVYTVVPAPRDLQITLSGATSVSVSWPKAEGIEKVPQSFVISYCSPGTKPHTEKTEDCYITLSGLLPGSQYTINVSTVLDNGEQSKPVSTTICTKLIEVQIVLVGMTRVGKSAAGNTILGRKAFQLNLGFNSVTSACEKAEGEVDGQGVTVIDTPGLLITKLSNEEALTEIKSCISLSSPGPHVFLFVIQVGRITKENNETVKIIQTTFGKQSANYTMVLFTHGDNLAGMSIKDYVDDSPDLQHFIKQCHGRYHVFNNSEQNPSQVTELLDKINKMVKRNGGSYYTNEMLEEAEREIEEEDLRSLEKWGMEEFERERPRDRFGVESTVVTAVEGITVEAVVNRCRIQ